MRRVLYVALCMVVTVAGFAFTSDAPAETRGVGLIRQRVEFTVMNSAEGNKTRQIVGYRYDTFCQSPTVVLLMHGLSYTKEAWDFPGYSVAQKIAEAGYAVIAIDRLGYGESKLDNGYQVGHEQYAGMAFQIVQQLRKQGFSHVVLGGQSAGAGTTEFEAGTLGGVDAIIAQGWHHRPSNQLGQDFFTGDYVRAAQDDYEYFLGTPEHRAEMFYEPDADPAVVEADTKAAVDTPSGEILTINKQPSRFVVGKIKVPVFLQFGEKDRLFELEYAKMHAEEFRSSPSVTVDVVPGAGHTFMLTKAGLAGTDRLVNWLRSRPEAPSCL
ncbi:MAG TPA: alpha/beta hydrolase [Acidimicrobiia bacterium]|nr:alpha/beta hydrolase [Acidimicrobiia bacterium]